MGRGICDFTLPLQGRLTTPTPARLEEGLYLEGGDSEVVNSELMKVRGRYTLGDSSASTKSGPRQ